MHKWKAGRTLPPRLEQRRDEGVFSGPEQVGVDAAGQRERALVPGGVEQRRADGLQAGRQLRGEDIETVEHGECFLGLSRLEQSQSVVEARVHIEGVSTKRDIIVAFVLPLLTLCNTAMAQKLTSDIPYIENGHGRHVLDIYTPETPADEKLPVMFWIHGGGWQQGDKNDVGLKPKVLVDRGFIFVSTNYRLLPEANMDELIGDVASSFGWVHRNIAKHGGDPNRIFVGGH